MKNPILFWLLLLFTITNTIDSITALFILPGEANPIFLLTGSIWAVFFGKALLIFFGWFLYSRNIFPSNMWYFIVIAALLFGSLAVSLGAFSNIWGMLNPSIVEKSAQMTKSEKIQSYFIVGIIIYLIPISFNILTFFLYDKSYKHTKINAAYYKKKKWWEL